jgi:hypothetical protein
MNHTVCETKTSLLARYRSAAKTYSDKLAELQRVMGTSSKADYDAFYRMTEALRIDARGAQQKLEQHVADHGC